MNEPPKQGTNISQAFLLHIYLTSIQNMIVFIPNSAAVIITVNFNC